MYLHADFTKHKPTPIVRELRQILLNKHPFFLLLLVLLDFAALIWC